MTSHKNFEMHMLRLHPTHPQNRDEPIKLQIVQEDNKCEWSFHMRVFILGLVKLISLPVDLFTLLAPPEILDFAVFILKNDRFHSLLPADHLKLTPVAFHASRKWLKQRQIQIKSCFNFFEHFLRVSFLGNQIDRHFMVSLAEQLCISRYNDSFLLLSYGLHHFKIAHIHIFAINSQIAHHRAKLLEHTINKELWLLAVQNFFKLLRINHLFFPNQMVSLFPVDQNLLCHRI